MAPAAPPPLSPLRMPWGVLLLSLLAFPVSYGLSLTAAMDDSRLVFLAGVVFCSLIAPLAYLCVVRGVSASTDVYFYVFTVFAFTSMVDLALALTIDGRTSVLMFYLSQGEVYLTTAHGLWINAWDGTFHYACYLFLTACMLRPLHAYSHASFRRGGLLWAGSILNSMIVLFVGSATGNHASDIKPSYLLNIPYGLFPAVFLWRILQARETPTPSTSTPTPLQHSKPLWAWLLDVPLLLLTFASMCLCILRALVVLSPPSGGAAVSAWYGEVVERHLRDPSAYPTLQMLVYAFYMVPFFLWSCSWVWSGPPAASAATASRGDFDSFMDWSTVALGALLQGTFSYMGAALHQGEAFQSEEWRGQRSTGKGATGEFTFIWFIGANLAMMLVPALTMARMSMQDANNTNTQAARIKAQ